MIKQPDAPEVLDREFLELRAGLLQIAAQLDRLDRAAGTVADDPRMHGVLGALHMLASVESGSAEPNRAEQVQLIFSRQYDPNWKEGKGEKEKVSDTFLASNWKEQGKGV